MLWLEGSQAKAAAWGPVNVQPTKKGLCGDLPTHEGAVERFRAQRDPVGTLGTAQGGNTGATGWQQHQRQWGNGEEGAGPEGMRPPPMDR